MSRRSMPYHRRYHQDALQGYRRLTLEERGAYTTILDLIYDEGGPIEMNDRWLAGELNCSVRKARSVIDALIAARKIYLTGAGKISNHRAESELENALKISRKCSENVAKREDKRREKTEISRKINAAPDRMMNRRSSIPDTRTIKEIDNSEYEVTRDERDADPRPLKKAAPDRERASPHPAVTIIGCDMASGPDEHVEWTVAAHGTPPYPDASSDRLINALEGRGEGRSRMFELVSVQRSRRH